MIDIKEIFGIFDKFGIKGGLLAIIIMFAWSFFKSSWFSGFMEKVTGLLFYKKTSNKSDVITESDILSHDIFNYIDFWIYSKVPIIKFSTEYRTAVFRKYLTIYLKSHKDNLRKFISDKSFQNMTDAELWARILKLINDIIYDYEREMKDSGIPDIVIEKMKVKNNDSVSLTIDLIEGICNSNFYKSESNLLKIYSILNIILSILENTISNSDKICSSINGQLKGLVFDGKKEP